MRNMFRRRIATFLTSVLLSVAALASPINVTAYAVTVPQTISLGLDDNSEVTQEDFVVAAPYVVDLAVATPVPIKQTAELAQLAIGVTATNSAVMQNGNFET